MANNKSTNRAASNKSATASTGTAEQTVEQNASTVTGTAEGTLPQTNPAPAQKAQPKHITGLVGTAAEIVASGVRLNGKPMDANAITVLRKFHFGTALSVEGYVERPQGQKGKPAEILKLSDAPGFSFTPASATVAA